MGKFKNTPKGTEVVLTDAGAKQFKQSYARTYFRRKAYFMGHSSNGMIRVLLEGNQQPYFYSDKFWKEYKLEISLTDSQKKKQRAKLTVPKSDKEKVK